MPMTREITIGDFVYTVNDPPDTRSPDFWWAHVTDETGHQWQYTGRRHVPVTCLECGREGTPDRYPRYMHRQAPTDGAIGWYCDPCLEYCNDCETWSIDPCGAIHEDEDEPGCSCFSCRDSYDGDGPLIHSYSYKPRAVFHGEDSKAFLGMELEVDTTGRRSVGTTELAEMAVRELGDLAYLKDDGSVAGFEMVTHPMTYLYAMESFPWGLLKELKDGGAEANDSCGLHVHVSRDGFDSPAHVYRWLKLIYRNERQVQHVARRTNSSWAKFGDARSRKVHKDYAKGHRSGERYQAVNVQNENTFEVRVFAASLDPEHVKSALGLVDASVEYTRQLTSYDIAHNDGWSWKAFMDWLPAKYEALKKEGANA